MIVDHELRAKLGGTFFARLGQEDHIAIEGDARMRLSVNINISPATTLSLSSTAPRPYVSAISRGRKRRERPLLGVNCDDVGMSQHEDRPLLSIALDSRHQIGTLRIAENTW